MIERYAVRNLMRETNSFLAKSTVDNNGRRERIRRRAHCQQVIPLGFFQHLNDERVENEDEDVVERGRNRVK